MLSSLKLRTEEITHVCVFLLEVVDVSGSD